MCRTHEKKTKRHELSFQNKKMNEVAKRKKGQVLNSNERQLILNLMHYLKEKNAGKSVSEVIREISKATGCSERTIYKIRKEASKGVTTTPSKRRLRKKENKNSRNVKYDNYVKSLIRQKIHTYLLQNISPTLNAILYLVNNDSELPNFKRSTLHTLLREIGFVYEQNGKKSLLTEEKDLVKSREEYLNNIRRFRSENRLIIYTGESLISLMKKELSKDEDLVNISELDTLIIEPMISNNAFDDESINAMLLNDDALISDSALSYILDSELTNTGDNDIINLNKTITSTLEEISEGTDGVHTLFGGNDYFLGEAGKIGEIDFNELDTLSPEGGVQGSEISRELRFTVLHARCEAGFLNGVDQILLSKKKNEELINYEKWFVDKLLPKIPPNSVIVIDNNAACQRKKEENVHEDAWKKHETAKNMNINVAEVNKSDLLALMHNSRSVYDVKHKIDEVAKQRGIILIDLPPYHYELNPLNMVWAQVKCHVRSNLKSFKVKEIKQLIKEGLYKISEVNWMNFIHRTYQTEDLLWTVDKFRESNHTKG